MRILFDIVHPAHVHFFKHTIRALETRGHTIKVVARDKDVTCALLDHERIPYVSVGSPQVGRLRQLRELAHRDFVLAREIRKHRIDVVATRNPSGVQAARAAGAIGIFDTDDGSAAGLHFKVARPFAHFLTSPDCIGESWGRRHVMYRGYKQSAYLHPDHFTPNPAILDELGLSRAEPFFLVRFVAMQASHDVNESGFGMAAKSRLFDMLARRGRVLLSCEGAVPAEWQQFAYRAAPHQIHDLMAFAQLVVGDSQTMAAEAAVLGTPSIRMSTWAGRLGYLTELEQRYALTFGFQPRDEAAFFAKLESLLGQPKDANARGHEQLLREKINVAAWYTDFIDSLSSRRA